MLTRWIIAILCTACACIPAWADTIVTVDSHTIVGQVVAISADGVTIEMDGQEPRTFALDDIDRIDVLADVELMTRNAQAVLVTPSGSMLTVSDLSSTGSKLKFNSPLLGKGTELDMSAVAWLYLPPSGKTAAEALRVCGRMKIEDKSLDTVVVQRKAGDYWPLQGVIKSITSDTVTFTRNEQDVKVARANVLAIRLAAIGEAKPTIGRAMLRDGLGAQVEFESITLKGGTCELTSRELGTLTVGQSAITSLRLWNQRVTALSSLEPASVKEHGLLGLATPYQKNRSTTGGPLRLGSTVHASGLGLHSFCELTYKLDGQYKQFVTAAGIDESAKPAGNARLTFLGDGKELDAPLDLTGKDDPVMVRLKLDGVKTLTIRVEYGADKVDVGDHVTLGGAKLIK
ncbi:MAG: NPCBM/NEW2 domain-containing protein [Phycisphaerae bacterium]|nr:NPCBM/NEW2 domain-containing protein [Phycisphaerae bacterium]